MEWISVKDRLPKIHERVIVFDTAGFAHIRMVMTTTQGYINYIDSYSEPHRYMVTHWMHLPNPPIN